MTFFSDLCSILYCAKPEKETTRIHTKNGESDERARDRERERELTASQRENDHKSNHAVRVTETQSIQYIDSNGGINQIKCLLLSCSHSLVRSFASSPDDSIRWLETENCTIFNCA